MKILLTNDDGYRSQGLQTLEQALLASGHEVWVCAPSTERSASSHSMTLRGEVKLTEYKPNHYHCSGTPADCILYASKGKLFPETPDLVISGINHGYNISTDILYSGTVGAAREASMNGWKAIAVSCDRSKDGLFAFEHAASFVVTHLDEFYPLCSSSCLININVPAIANGKWKTGLMSYLDYHDAIETKNEEKTHVFDTSQIHFGTSIVLTLKPGLPPAQRCSTQGTDFQAVADGYISVSALSILPPLHEQTQLMLTQLAKENCDG